MTTEREEESGDMKGPGNIVPLTRLIAPLVAPGVDGGTAANAQSD